MLKLKLITHLYHLYIFFHKFFFVQSKKYLIFINKINTRINNNL